MTNCHTIMTFQNVAWNNLNLTFLFCLYQVMICYKWFWSKSFIHFKFSRKQLDIITYATIQLSRCYCAYDSRLEGASLFLPKKSGKKSCSGLLKKGVGFLNRFENHSFCQFKSDLSNCQIWKSVILKRTISRFLPLLGAKFCVLTLFPTQRLI